VPHFGLCDSPHGSNGSAPSDPFCTRLAAEALGGGPYRKSPLLDLADQLGSAAVAAAQAAAQRGQPLSYEAVMQLLQPLEERVREALGAPMQEVPGWQLDDMRRVSKSCCCCYLDKMSMHAGAEGVGRAHAQLRQQTTQELDHDNEGRSPPSRVSTPRN
jgi:hypothetical protein